MSETRPDLLARILAFASVTEICTGLVLMLDPALVAKLLLGVDATGLAILFGRCFGVSLLALGLACWPDRQTGEVSTAAGGAMLAYNTLIAAYLAYLGTVDHLAGMLLWPAVVLHAVVALLLFLNRNKRRQSG